MIHIIFGTRAQLIKIAPVIIALKKMGQKYNIVFTGQHKESIQDLLSDFSINDKLNTIYSGKEVSGILHMFRWVVLCLWRSLRNKSTYFPTDNRKCDIFLVHGDTLSTLLGALTGKLLGARVAQIEAGLRSYRLFHPFPEEITRILVFKLSDIAFCPGEWAYNNMRKYNLTRINTYYNTINDTLRFALKKNPGNFSHPDNKYCVVSIHRFENIFRSTVLKMIVDNILIASDKVLVVFVLHPATKKQLIKNNLFNILEKNKNIQLMPRMNYTRFISLLSHSEFVITDGGSNQEELSYMGVPTFLMRMATERKEGLDSNILLGQFNNDNFLYFIKNYDKYRNHGSSMNDKHSSVIISTYLADTCRINGIDK